MRLMSSWLRKILVAHLVSCFKIPISSLGTIAENIAQVVPMRHARKFLKQPVLLTWIPFVQHLDNGYDTALQMTAGLFIGQCQLIAIAQSVLANAISKHPWRGDISPIDSRTEKMAQLAMDRLMELTYGFQVTSYRLFNHCQFWRYHGYGPRTYHWTCLTALWNKVVLITDSLYRWSWRLKIRLSLSFFIDERFLLRLFWKW